MIGQETSVRIPVEEVWLDGDLYVPSGARGVVLFAHGSGSSRFSARNRYVARQLQEGGLGTLLVDLLTQEEEAVDMETAHLRFDIDLLAERLLAATEFLTQTPETMRLRIGNFGSSTGAAAALVAAAQRPDVVGAVVSRGGRPDLAGRWLEGVQAPTLLIVGGADVPVVGLNRRALALMHCERKLDIVPGATHLFEEPGALEQVASLAGGWFVRYLHRSEQPRAEMPHPQSSEQR